MFSKEDYARISSEDGEAREDQPLNSELDGANRRSRRWLARVSPWIVIIFLGLFNSVLLLALYRAIGRAKTGGNTERCQVLYSPAQEAITYEVKMLDTDTHNQWFGPITPELDEAWESLYNGFGISQINHEQALLLSNPSDPIPIDHKYHFVELSVFHQLHCLNNIRKVLHIDRYQTVFPDLPPGGIDWKHVDHCIETMRQALICGADITPMPWQFNKFLNRSAPNPDMPHSCRSYDKIVDWAKANKAEDRFSAYVIPA